MEPIASNQAALPDAAMQARTMGCEAGIAICKKSLKLHEISIDQFAKYQLPHGRTLSMPAIQKQIHSGETKYADAEADQGQ